MKTRAVALFTLLAIALIAMPVLAQDDSSNNEDEVKSLKDDLTLKRLFEDRVPWGPSASQTAFSQDGRFGGYLYRPYDERRHGSDLWLYDTATGESKRITGVSVMAEFTRNARTVKEDRIKKHKQSKRDRQSASKGQDDGVSGEWSGAFESADEDGFVLEDDSITLNISVDDEGNVTGSVTAGNATADVTKGSFDAETGSLELTLKHEDSGIEAELHATIKDGAMTGEMELGIMGIALDFSATRSDASGGDTSQLSDDELADMVTEKDADDRRAPRYSGINSFVWAPEANELIFTASGDLYLYDVEEEDVTRLTRTRDRESNVQFLPDGSGYTYLHNGALMHVKYDSGIIQQLDPQLENGESMSSYEISPDGTRVAFLARRGGNMFGGGRTVNIVNYRNRFAQVREVSRHMPDDTFPEIYTSVYLYDINDHLLENGTLKRVFTHKHAGPRDAISTPHWALDSSRVAFAVYDQGTGQATIYESRITGDEAEAAAAENDSNADDDDTEEQDEQQQGDSDAERDESEPEIVIEPARAVYRFLHYGGPNTPGMIEPMYLADHRRVAFIAEISGFRQLHTLDPVYEQLDQVTRGQYELYPIAMSKDRKRLFATATKDDPTQEHVFAVDLESGEMTKLSTDVGVYSSVAVSDDGSHVLATFVDFGDPRELYAIEVTDELDRKKLTDSHPKEVMPYVEPEPEYFTYENRHGHTIHGHMFKPDDWSPEDQRPLLIYVYGGPLGTRKMVTRGSFSSDSYYFAYYMAKKHGFVTCTIDPRGVSGYGGLFERSNFEKAGRAQVEDIVDGVEWFIANHGVDSKRVSMHGWSFGGFQTQMCLYTEPDVFACGIAGAGPTEWLNYNSWYTTGTIGEKENLSEGLSDPKYSLLPLAKNLKAKLLLVHGMEDSNVLYQDTVRVYRALLQAGKETLVELFLDPTGGHGLGGDVDRINRYRKYEEFLLRCLGTGEPATQSEDAG